MSEAIVRALFQNSPDGVFVSTAAGTILDVNFAGVEMFGYTREELLSMPASDLYVSKASRDEYVRQMKAQGAVRNFETEYRRKDGSRIWISETSTTWTDPEQGERFLCIARDTTSQHELQEALFRSREMYRSFLLHLPVGFVVKDLDGRYTDFNDAYVHMAGLPREDILGKTQAELPVEPPEPPPELQRYHVNADVKVEDEQVVRTGMVEREDVVYVAGDERFRLFRVVKTLTRNSSGDPESILTIFWDTTEQKLAEDALRTAVHELSNSNRDLEQFAYVASHDLQEPLRMISSYTDLLKARYADQLDDDAKEFIAYAVDGAYRMQALIGDLLAFSRVGRSNRPFVPVNVGDVVDTVLRSLELFREEKAAEITCDPLPVISCDSVLITQIFQNLVENGMKYQQDRTPIIHIGCETTSEGPTFFVKDNGIGIAPEFHQRVFEIFRRLHGKRRYSGTGIGLALVKKAVEHHGGRIWVESEAGKGATFRFTIPQRRSSDRNHPGTIA